MTPYTLAPSTDGSPPINTSTPTPTLSRAPDTRASTASKLLRWSVTSWFVTAMAGQLMFVAYIIAFYGRTTAQGDMGRWNDVMGVGLIDGDPMGNTALAAHLLFAAYITLSGLIQLVPQIRQRAPRLHRWNGRLYMVAAVIMSVGGLWLTWARVDTFYGTLGKLGTSVNAIVILIFAAKALSTARARSFAAHRRWAMRLFMAVSGVWFLRVLMMVWVLINQGPVGFGDNLDGPAWIMLTFLQFLLPLAVLELYFHAQTTPHTARRTATAALIAVLTLAMAVGLVMASMGMWLPNMSG